MTARRPLLFAVVGGLLTTLTVPPFGWWPLVFPGIALLATALVMCASVRSRVAVGLVFGLAHYVPGLWWMTQFSLPGGVIVAVIQAVFMAASMVLVVPTRATSPDSAHDLTDEGAEEHESAGVVSANSRSCAQWRTWATVPVAVIVADVLRTQWPFGGLPLAGFDLGQARGPLASVVGFGGRLLLVGLCATGGTALAAGIGAFRVAPRRRAAPVRMGFAATEFGAGDLGGMADDGVEPGELGSGGADFGGEEGGSGRPGGFRGRLSGDAANDGPRPRLSGSGRPGGFRGLLSGDAANDGPRPRLSGSGRPGGFRGRLSGDAANDGPRPRLSGRGRADALRPVRTACVLAVITIATPAVTRTLPDGTHATGMPRLRVAIVQGGGPVGQRASPDNARRTYEAHLRATANIKGPIDLILWPEDVVDVERLDGSAEEATLSSIAVRYKATFIAGVVEDVSARNFVNVAVAWGPDGTPSGRFQKVRLVPYGEFFWGRSVVENFATLPSHDAIPGRGPGVLRTPAGVFAVSISYEGFFDDRARGGVRAKGEVLLIPTNASSYRNAHVPTQQLAAARLRARETGRWVAQAAPTGFSAVIDHKGRLLARTDLGAAAVIEHAIVRRTGLTPYARFNDAPMLLVTALVALAAWARPRRRSPRPGPASSRRNEADPAAEAIAVGVTAAPYGRD